LALNLSAFEAGFSIHFGTEYRQIVDQDKDFR
jgi:hypothetical protein